MKKHNVLLFLAVTSLALSGCANRGGDATIGYTVQFNSHGGTPINTMVNVNVIEHEPLTIRDGYSFKGWYENTDFTQKISFPYTVTKSLTLHADWTEGEQATYTVHFNTHGGTEISDMVTSLISTSPESTKEGYYLEGWYTSENYGSDEKISFPYTVTKEVTLHAKWEIVKKKIQFWGWGDEAEIQVFKDLVKQYNANNTDNIYVEYTVKPSSSYAASMDKILGQNKTPDIFYVGDGDVKRWATYDYLEDLTSYVAESTIIDLDDIWEEGVNRYRYNITTKSSEATDPLFCLPKSNEPSVLYYNVDAFKAVGITIISKPESECTEAEKHGFNVNTRTFNNRISMTFEEEYELAKLLTKSYNSSSPTTYGFYTEWWFNYLWSVGGDSLEKDPDGTYHWTLGSTEPNGTTEHPLPSNRQMFQQFIDRSVTQHVMPNPSTVSSVAKVSAFVRQNVAMLAGLRTHVPYFRRGCSFEWDVAPLSHQEGGRLAGHSGSMGFGISKKVSQDRKDAAFKFMEYLAGPVGQKALANSGLAIPNQKSISRTEDFLQTDQYPHNSIAFVEAAEYQTGGDWTYLIDNLWIDDWARDLYGPVLDGTMTLDQFFAKHQNTTDQYLNEHYR